jgi:hypothetical protein
MLKKKKIWEESVLLAQGHTRVLQHVAVYFSFGFFFKIFFLHNMNNLLNNVETKQIDVVTATWLTELVSETVVTCLILSQKMIVRECCVFTALAWGGVLPHNLLASFNMIIFWTYCGTQFKAVTLSHGTLLIPPPTKVTRRWLGCVFLNMF